MRSDRSYPVFTYPERQRVLSKYKAIPRATSIWMRLHHFWRDLLA